MNKILLSIILIIIICICSGLLYKYTQNNKYSLDKFVDMCYTDGLVDLTTSYVNSDYDSTYYKNEKLESVNLGSFNNFNKYIQH